MNHHPPPPTLPDLKCFMVSFYLPRKIFKSGTSQIILKCIDRGTSVQNPTKNIYLVDADVPIIEWSTQDDMQLINFNDYIKKVMRTKKIRQLSENECDMKLDLHAPPPETPVYCTETNE